MVSKKYWEKLVVEFANLVRNEREIRKVKILESSFEVFPGVFSPFYSTDTAWFAERMIPLTKKKKFLEIGSGTGAIACLAAMHGAKSVVATDINGKAVENIHANAKLHSLSISIRAGSMFEPIAKDELFDIIFWNHPFYHTDKNINNDNALLAVFDTHYQFLNEFFRSGKQHLEKGGQLILGTGNVARINLIKQMAADYDMVLLEKAEVPIFKEKKTKMDVRLYCFKPRFSQVGL